VEEVLSEFLKRFIITEINFEVEHASDRRGSFELMRVEFHDCG
jgi:hypothetical protein